jgi:hypothetical protein
MSALEFRLKRRLEYNLRIAIENNDEHKVRILLENGLDSKDEVVLHIFHDYDVDINDEDNLHILLGNVLDNDIINLVLITAYRIKNYNIIDLLYKSINYNNETNKYFGDTYQFLINKLYYALNFDFMGYKTDIEAEKIIDIVIDNYKNNNVLDELIKQKGFDKIIRFLNDLRQDNFKYSQYLEDEMYENIKGVIEKRLFSLIFRSCALTEVDKLRKKLHDLGIDEIDGNSIDGIKSETNLCDLIEHGLKINIHKYDDIDFTKIKPAVRRVTYDNDDESLSDN